MLPDDFCSAKYISLSVDDLLNAALNDDNDFVGPIFRQLAISIQNARTDAQEQPLELSKLQQRLEGQLEESIRRGWESHKKQTGGLRRGTPKPNEVQTPKRKIDNNYEETPAVGKNGKIIDFKYNE